VNELQQEILRAHEDVRRGAPGAQRTLERLQAEYRTSGALVERPGGSARVIEAGSTNGSSQTGTIERIGAASTVTKRRPPRRPATQRPSWQLCDHEPHSYDEVEIRLRSGEAREFSVSLGGEVCQEIRDAIDWLHRNVGPEYETGGFLFGTQRRTNGGSTSRSAGRSPLKAHARGEAIEPSTSSLELDQLMCCAQRRRPCST
jgi:hypothetical protein